MRCDGRAGERSDPSRIGLVRALGGGEHQDGVGRFDDLRLGGLDERGAAALGDLGPERAHVPEERAHAQLLYV